MDKLTITEVARQLCDGLDLDVNDIKNKLKGYLKQNPMSLHELNEMCWEDSVEIFDLIQ